jgi:hypothetical protein
MATDKVTANQKKILANSKQTALPDTESRYLVRPYACRFRDRRSYFWGPVCQSRYHVLATRYWEW